MSTSRDVVGADAMLAAYNSARDAVKAAHSKRKQATALRVGG